MYKTSFSSYILSGLLSGAVIALVSVLIFFSLSLLFNFEVQVIGENRNQLYVAFVGFASFFSPLLGAILFYFLKTTSRPVLFFSIFTALVFIGNTVMAETQLQSQYVGPAHILHVIVAILAIYLIPHLVKRKNATLSNTKSV
ncbi:hypothetical protein ACOI1C_11885 [Bacillus sp. DJP31]|uniref:hypothetical protein n=1 Tax=Bacillus sp. DJP31 TaxID=3409789 RepID=UPI003BB5946F